MTAGRIVAAGVTLALAPLLSAAGVTYVDVAPIIYKHCSGCHHPNDIAPMSLLSYREARPWATAIREAVVSRQMPPWKADPRFGVWSNDWSLSDSDVAAVKAWVDQGS